MIPWIIAASGGAGAVNQYMQNNKNPMSSTMTGQQQGWMKEAGDSWSKDLSGKPTARGLAKIRDENIVAPGWSDFQKNSVPRLQSQMGQNFFGNAKQSILKDAAQKQQDLLDRQTAEMVYNENQDARLRQQQARQGLQGLVDINSLAYTTKPGIMDQAGQLLGSAAAIQGMYNQRNRDMGYIPPPPPPVR